MYFCMQDTFARATHSAGRPSAARDPIGYLVYNMYLVIIFIFRYYHQSYKDTVH